MEQRGIEQLEHKIGEGPRVIGEFLPEGSECHFRSREDQQRAQKDQIQEVDDDQRKKAAVGSQVGLALGNHPEGEAEVKRPGEAEQSEQDGGVRLEIVEDADPAVEGDDSDGVQRPEIGGESDPEVRFVRDDVAAVARGFEVKDVSSHRLGHDRVGQFVAENVDPQRPGFTVNPKRSRKRDGPEDDAKGEEPEFFGEPEGMVLRDVGEAGEQRLGENPRGRQQKEGDDVVEPPGGNRRMSAEIISGFPAEKEPAACLAISGAG